MPIARLHKILSTPIKNESSPNLVFWLSLSLTFSAIYSLLALREAFGSAYVVQDDARQHVFWMLRFIDPELFPHNLIADYFQSVAPAGYSIIYQIAAAVGFNPFGFNKLLPLVLGLLTTAYCFGVCLQMLPIPSAGFMATLLLNQNLWNDDDLVSGTPRAFVYGLLLAFLYYLLRRSLLPCLVAIAFIGLFYPQCIFLCTGLLILQLTKWQDGRFCVSRNRQDYLFCAAGLGAVLLVMLPYALTSSEFGPVITAAQARQLPEFQIGGRSEFFVNNFKDFWFSGDRSGMFPRALFTPVTLCAGLLLPVLALFPAQFPLVRQIKSSILVLPQLFLVSVAMFFAAHALLFKLHLPSRYTSYSFRVIVALASAIAFCVILDALLNWASGTAKPFLPLRKSIALGTTALIGAALVLYPSFLKHFPDTGYVEGKAPALYKFFQEQPKDSLIASLSDEANYIPTFARRSILVGREYAIPYHWGYYRQFRQQTLDLIRAQYSPNWADVQGFLKKYNVDFWLLEKTAFTPGYFASNSWLQPFEPATGQALASLQQGTLPALSSVMKNCSVFETDSQVVLGAPCLKSIQQDKLGASPSNDSKS
jgi:hypothetical protein